METTQVNKITENTHSIIAEETINTISDIHKFVDHNEYRYNTSPFKYLNNSQIENAVLKLTLNQLKKLKKAINIFRFKPTLKSANRFYHFLFKEVLYSSTRIKINYSLEQVEIMNSRKKYVEARKAMLESLDKYKSKKGDFYKLRLANNQNIL